MFDEQNYTCVKPETVYETQGLKMVYTEYMTMSLSNSQNYYLTSHP